jgi:hypothetical protein
MSAVRSEVEELRDKISKLEVSAFFTYLAIIKAVNFKAVAICKGA